MQNSAQQKTGLKVKPDSQTVGTFELKTSDGQSLGFVMNGSGKGPSFVIAGSGTSIRSVYQQVLMWPATKVIHGRLALVLLDKITGEDASDALREVTCLLAPVRDSLFLPSTDAEPSQAATAALQTIENFSNKHGLFSSKTGTTDCASL